MEPNMNEQLILDRRIEEKIIHIMQKHLSLKDKDLWSKKDIANYLDVSVKSVDRMVVQPDFPKPIIIKGTKINRYKQIEVRRWLV